MNGLERLRALGARLEGLAVERATVAVDGKPLWRVLLDIAGQIECEQVEGGAWVREHGGLEPIKSSLSALELLAEGIEIDTGLAFYDESPKERCVALRNEVKSRLMPEGMEWPCFDDGEPVRIGDEAPFGSDGRMVVTGIELVEGGFVLHGRDGGIERPCQTGYKVGVRVKRPAPKVLDADGVEILEKRDAWWICEGDERGVHAERLRVETICPNGLIECSPYNGGTWVYLEPSELYVNEPVPASDGRPLEVGQTVWTLDDPSFECVVLKFGNGTVHLKSEPDHLLQRNPSQLTHERPAIGADGELVKSGDTVWCVATDEQLGYMGINPESFAVYRDELTVYCVYIYDGELWASLMETIRDVKVHYLTHQRPESWGSLEDDATLPAATYCERMGIEVEEGCSFVEPMARDLVRRAKALAGVSE